MAAASWLQGCTGHVSPGQSNTTGGTVQAQGNRVETKHAVKTAERDCLIRAMYFESNRSSRDGLMAVGTVVMNRVASPLHPNTICGVVGEPRQFAPGVLTRAMNQRELALAESTADAVLRSERYAPVGEAMHFHMADLDIPYRVRYVATAGGNAFYLRGGRRAKETAPSVVVTAATADVTHTPARVEPKPSLVERLYASLTAAPAAKTCAAASSAFAPSC